jgi:hypothetical protein
VRRVVPAIHGSDAGAPHAARGSHRPLGETPKTMRPRRQRPEQTIQRTVFQHIDARAAPGVFAFHPANGGYRKPIETKIMAGLGVRPGIPDVFVSARWSVVGSRASRRTA